MYHSPIDILTTDIRHQIEKGTDEEIYKAVVSVGINVDKDELLRALKYDRQQYQKGYWDGITDGQPKWIPVTERLPENDYGKHWKERKYYIVCLQGGRIRVAQYGFKEYGWWVDSHSCVLSKDHYTEVTHWMESPHPPKGE